MTLLRRRSGRRRTWTQARPPRGPFSTCLAWTGSGRSGRAVNWREVRRLSGARTSRVGWRHFALDTGDTIPASMETPGRKAKCPSLRRGAWSRRRRLPSCGDASSVEPWRGASRRRQYNDAGSLRSTSALPDETRADFKKRRRIVAQWEVCRYATTRRNTTTSAVGAGSAGAIVAARSRAAEAVRREVDGAGRRR